MENTGKVINATADNCSTLKDGQWSVYTVSLTEAQASAVDAHPSTGSPNRILRTTISTRKTKATMVRIRPNAEAIISGA